MATKTRDDMSSLEKQFTPAEQARAAAIRAEMDAANRASATPWRTNVQNPELTPQTKPDPNLWRRVAGDRNIYDNNSPIDKKSSNITGSRKAITPEELSEMEKSYDKPAASVNSTKAGALAGTALSAGGNAKRALGWLTGSRSGRIGGGLAGGVLATILILTVFGGSYELIHLRENLLGNSNKLANYLLEQRRNRNFYRVLYKINSGDLNDKINSAKLAKKLETKGFVVETDGKKVTKFGYTATIDGKRETRFFDLNATNRGQAVKDFFDAGDFGKQASMAMDAAVGGRAQTWKGKAARSLYGNLGIKFRNWLDDKAAKDKAKTERGKFAAVIRAQQATQTPGSAVHSIFTDKDTISEQNSTVDPETGEKKSPFLGDANEQAVAMADKYRNDALANPDVEPTTTTGDAKLDKQLELAQEAEDTVKQSNGSFSQLLSSISVTDLGKKFAAKILGAFNVVSVYSDACAVNGTLLFISNMQSILMSYQLASFALNMISAADHQKAGILSSSGVQLATRFFNTRDPVTNKTAMQEGALRNFVLGEKTARPSEVSWGKYNGGRAPRGILGQISSYTNTVMIALGGTGGCSFANNGVVQIAGLIIGIGLAIVTGGASAGAEAVFKTGIAIAETIAVGIALQLAIKMASGIFVSGLEPGEAAGAMFSSGGSALLNMNSGANSLRVATNKEVAAIEKQADAQIAYRESQKSIYDRYFNLDNDASLIVKTLATASSYNHLSTIGEALSKPGSLFTGIVSTLTHPNKASAADIDNRLCDDRNAPLMQDNDIAVDVWCRPVMAQLPNLDTDKTEQLLLDNKMVEYVTEGNDKRLKVVAGSEFENYIVTCLSGRPSTLYNPTVPQDGTDNGTMPFELDDGRVIQYSSDKPHDLPCMMAGPVLPGDNVGRFDRYADMYGYLIDEAGIEEWLNDDYTATAYNDLYFIDPAELPETKHYATSHPKTLGSSVGINGIEWLSNGTGSNQSATTSTVRQPWAILTTE